MSEPKGRGGRRPGAGRPRKAPVEPTEFVLQEDQDMLTLLQKIALGQVKASPLQVRAAIAAVQYTHTKTKDGGKKKAKQEEADKVASRFSPAPAPKLVASGGKKV